MRLRKKRTAAAAAAADARLPLPVSPIRLHCVLATGRRPSNCVSPPPPTPTFVKGSFHAFVEMINNAPSQVLQIGANILQRRCLPALPLCTRAPGLCLRCEDPDLAPLTPASPPTTVWLFSASQRLKRCFSWPLSSNVYFSEFSLNFGDVYQWLETVLLDSVPVLSLAVCPFIIGCEGQTLPSSGFVGKNPHLFSTDDDT